VVKNIKRKIAEEEPENPENPENPEDLENKF
jgi:hypothetical protein